MVAQPERSTMTVEEYLTLERVSPVKHEFVDGCMYAMAGGTVDHDRIANNVRSAIDAHLADGPCAVHGPDVRVRVSPAVYYYPDALVVCEPMPGDAVEVTAPRLIVEVLSTSTEADDRGDKFANYQTILTLEEYLLVDSRRRAVERYRRAEHGLWVYQRYEPGAELSLESIRFSCPIAMLYRRTQL